MDSQFLPWKFFPGVISAQSRKNNMARNETPLPKGTTMSKLAEKAIAVYDHVVRNRAKYAAAGTTVFFAGVLIARARVWNEFLDEHDLTDTFYGDPTEEI